MYKKIILVLAAQAMAFSILAKGGSASENFVLGGEAGSGGGLVNKGGQDDGGGLKFSIPIGGDIVTLALLDLKKIGGSDAGGGGDLIGGSDSGEGGGLSMNGNGAIGGGA